MYGLVNRGIAEMVRSQHGEDVWDDVMDAAGIDDDVFLGMEAYDDAVTYDLVGGVCTVLGIEASDALEAFGEYWITSLRGRATASCWTWAAPTWGSSWRSSMRCTPA